MKYEALGATEISVSKICIGGMSFGKDEAHPDVWALDEKETEAMIGHAFDLGVNFIDTANAYAMGRSEEMIGKGNAAPNGHIPFTPHAKQVLELSLL